MLSCGATESGAISEHFPGFFHHRFTIQLQNIKAMKSETFLVSLTHAIKARDKQVAKEKLYIFNYFPYAMYPLPNI